MTLDRLRQVTAASGLAPALMLCASSARAEGTLELAPDPAVLIPLLLLYVILVPVLNVLLFQPILRTLEAREARIDGARKRAEALGREVEQTLAQYSKPCVPHARRRTMRASNSSPPHSARAPIRPGVSGALPIDD